MFVFMIVLMTVFMIVIVVMRMFMIVLVFMLVIVNMLMCVFMLLRSVNVRVHVLMKLLHLFFLAVYGDAHVSSGDPALDGALSREADAGKSKRVQFFDKSFFVGYEFKERGA